MRGTEREPDGSTGATFERLDPRVVGLWRLQGCLTGGVLFGACVLGGIWTWLSDPAAHALGLGFFVVGAFAFLVLTAWLPSRSFRATSYRVDDRVLEVRSGVVFRVSQLVPLTRLQHVDLRSGPLERGFGLSSLIVHTAGTHQASVTVPGLARGTAAALRDRLVEAVGDDAV